MLIDSKVGGAYTSGGAVDRARSCGLANDPAAVAEPKSRGIGGGSSSCAIGGRSSQDVGGAGALAVPPLGGALSDCGGPSLKLGSIEKMGTMIISKAKST